MSTIRVNSLRALQEDLRWPLIADEFFSDLPVINFRPAEFDTEVSRLLGTVTTTGGKCGACIVVMPLEAVDDFTDASAFHPLRCRITFLVLEVPQINLGAAGTQKSALSICERIRQVMKHRILGGYSNCLAPDDPTFAAVQDPVAPVAWEVRFVTFAGVDQNFVKCENPVVDYNPVTGECSLSCPNTPDPTIYYTLDGSYPFTSTASPNAGAILYTGTFVLEGEWTLRVAGYAVGFLPSNVNFLRSTDIGDGSGSIGGLQ